MQAISNLELQQEDGSWIDARTLHKELGVGKEFANWIKGRIEKYDFIEDEDYKLTIAKIGKRSNVIQKDYYLTLDMAKELSMVENNRRAQFCSYMKSTNPILDWL